MHVTPTAQQYCNGAKCHPQPHAHRIATKTTKIVHQIKTPHPSGRQVGPTNVNFMVRGGSYNILQCGHAGDRTPGLLTNKVREHQPTNPLDYEVAKGVHNDTIILQSDMDKVHGCMNSTNYNYILTEENNEGTHRKWIWWRMRWNGSIGRQWRDTLILGMYEGLSWTQRNITMSCMSNVVEFRWGEPQWNGRAMCSIFELNSGFQCGRTHERQHYYVLLVWL